MTLSQVFQKPQLLMHKLMPLTVWFWMTDVLLSKQIGKSIGMSSGSVHTVLTEILGMSKLSVKIGPKNTDARAQVEKDTDSFAG